MSSRQKRDVEALNHMVDVLKEENTNNKRELLKAGRELNERVSLTSFLDNFLSVFFYYSSPVFFYIFKRMLQKNFMVWDNKVLLYYCSIPGN